MAIRARKRFGQHFLHDQRVINRIIDAIEIDNNNTLVEIGPGTGALTRPLLARVPVLNVIEIDRDLADLLEKNPPAGGQLIVHRADVLEVELCNLVSGRLTVVGNLPYNISTPLMFHLLEHAGCIDRMIFMVQKEVADRLAAEPGSGDYGRLSVMVQSLCRVEYLFSVSPGSFSPPPKVESAVIRLIPEPLQGLTIQNRRLFADVVRTAFTKRRKTIRNALKTLASEDVLTRAGILLTVRPEEITVADYIQLANLLCEE